MKKHIKGIKDIKSGCIDYYYSLKVETSLNIYELRESIQDKISSTINNYNSGILSILEKDIGSKIKEEGIEKINVRIDCNQGQQQEKILNTELDLISQKIVEIGIDTTEKGIKITLISEAQKQIDETKKDLEVDYTFNSDIYGEVYVDNYSEIILPPYKIKLINNSYVFIKAILYMFDNGMMVLRITVPIKNVNIAPLFENNADSYIKSIIDIYNLKIDINDNNIEAIKRSYYNFILSSNKKNKNIIVIPKVLKNIILVDFDGIPLDIKDISEDVKEDLFRVSVAPIQKREDISFKSRANEYIDNNSYTYDGIKYIANSMGRCISIIDKNTTNYIENNMDVSCREDAYNIAISTARRNLEYTFIIMLLKNMNSDLTYFEKNIHRNNIDKTQRDYNYNLIFILKLQQNCFGSVREQLDFFENKMVYFLDIKSNKEKMEAIDSIIESEKTIRSLRLQNFLSIGGFLITVIFGLPAINDTLTILRKSNLFINKDVPILTIENCSITIWGVLIINLIYRIWLKNIDIKNILFKSVYKLKLFLKGCLYKKEK